MLECQNARAIQAIHNRYIIDLHERYRDTYKANKYYWTRSLLYTCNSYRKHTIEFQT